MCSFWARPRRSFPGDQHGNTAFRHGVSTLSAKPNQGLPQSPSLAPPLNATNTQDSSEMPAAQWHRPSRRLLRALPASRRPTFPPPGQSSSLPPCQGERKETPGSAKDIWIPPEPTGCRGSPSVTQDPPTSLVSAWPAWHPGASQGLPRSHPEDLTPSLPSRGGPLAGVE